MSRPPDEVAEFGTIGVIFGEVDGLNLPRQRIRADRTGQGAGSADLQACVDGEQSGVEGHVVAGAGGQARPPAPRCCSPARMRMYYPG